ncbi:P-loop containing nucleoside triphosphate hydrolase protein [Lentinula raphanica]|nr:P-loop containing nucleoside triphosphate hydrolase protein [Lentinula raphanica]
MSSLTRKLTRKNNNNNSQRGHGSNSKTPEADSNHFSRHSQDDQRNSASGHNKFGNSAYAERCKALMNLYRTLLALGADMFIDLPKIAVIGAQSAGKSSLIEAVSGINVPRDSGICTRCPVELSMSSFVEEWECTISLRYNISENSGGNSTSTVFCTLSAIEKSNVDLWLRRAQAAILSHERPISDFQNMGLAKLKALRPGEGSMRAFSMDVIQVDLKDPELTDLTFIDLPGLIQNAAQNEIVVPRSLVENYIRGTETLVLVTIPMTDDMENQEAARLAKQADPSGKRTIGILTKPDGITRGATGARQRWKEVLEGKLHPLHHGYYCVRLADDEERAKQLGRSESEALASEFFSKTEPWSEFVDRSRFGVPNFVKDLSELLLRMIETNLPRLRTAVANSIKECSEKLDAMPVIPTEEPSTVILLRISDFCREVRRAVMGEDHKFLVHDNKRHYRAFEEAIKHTELDFQPVLKYSAGLKDLAGLHKVGPFDLEDVRKEIDQALTWELPGIIPFDAIKNMVLKSTTIWPASTNQCLDAVFQSTRSAIEVLIEIHFKQFSKLETLIRNLSYTELGACKTKALNLVQKLSSQESVPLYTQNLSYFKEEQRRWLNQYTDIYRAPINTSLRPHPFDPYENELSVMATVSAYFGIASKRFVDQIPLAIEHELNQLFAANIHQVLVDSVMSGANVAERMKELLSEDETITARRQNLTQRLARLREIAEKLSRFS